MPLTCENKVRPSPVTGNREHVGEQAPERLDHPGDGRDALVHLCHRGLHLLHILPVVVGRDAIDAATEPLADAVRRHHAEHEAPVKLLGQHPEPRQRRQLVAGAILSCLRRRLQGRFDEDIGLSLLVLSKAGGRLRRHFLGRSCSRTRSPMTTGRLPAKNWIFFSQKKTGSFYRPLLNLSMVNLENGCCKNVSGFLEA
jgi:hypothetical protein